MMRSLALLLAACTGCSMAFAGLQHGICRLLPAPAPRAAGVGCAAVVMMAKKKDRKEGRVEYTGRRPMAQKLGLEHRHEKMPPPKPDLAAPTTEGLAKKSSKKLSPLQLKALQALEQFEANNPEARLQEGEGVKRGGAAAAHSAAQRQRTEAEKLAKRAKAEEDQENYLAEQERFEKFSSESAKRGRMLMAELSPRSGTKPVYAARMKKDPGLLETLSGRATARGTQDTAPLEDTAPLDLEDETDEEEDDYADTELEQRTEEQNRKRSRWFAGYFKPREY